MLKKHIALFLFLLLSGIFTFSCAQEQDTTKFPNLKEQKFSKKNPKTAAYLSMVLPGAGQIYNQKYYKIPLIYGGFSSLLFFAKLNDNLYHEFLNRYSAYGLPGPVKFYDENIPENILKRYKDYYRRNRDMLYIGVGMVYLFNILDAIVDAHMSYFDVGSEFAMKMSPNIMPVTQYKAGIGVSFVVNF